MTYSPVVALSVLLILAASGQGRVVVDGQLTYAAGSGVYAFDLKTRRLTTLIDTELTHYHSVSILNDTSVLLDSDGLGGDRILLLDRTTGRLDEVQKGYQPVVMPGGRRYFFFKSSTGSGPRLYLADTGQLGAEGRQIAAEEPEFGSYSHVVPVADDEVVFNLEGDGAWRHRTASI